MSISFSPICNQQLDILSEYANQIWHECYRELLSINQINYMIEKFHSISALKNQIANGMLYFILYDESTRIGYLGYEIERDDIFISKLYLEESARGKNYTRKIIDYLYNIAKQHHLKKLYLTVNKYNNRAIKVYEHLGFINIRAVITDIGSGYVMDDFIYEKHII